MISVGAMVMYTLDCPDDWRGRPAGKEVRPVEGRFINGPRRDGKEMPEGTASPERFGRSENRSTRSASVAPSGKDNSSQRELSFQPAYPRLAQIPRRGGLPYPRHSTMRGFEAPVRTYE
jgi:hypothetical protein